MKCEIKNMLKKFEVCNFKCFDEKLSLDFMARDYKFNNHIVKNSIVNKAIIYGKNGSGKTSLGCAMFDIITHLTDKQRLNYSHYHYYKNLNRIKEPIEFSYTFQFDEDELVYKYQKDTVDSLINEELILNGEPILFYDYLKKRKNYIDSKLFGNINIDLTDNKLSIIKYIYRNTPTNDNSPISKLMKFANSMLWYRSLSEGNCYAGFTNGSSALVDKLYENRSKLKDFEKFLKENGLDYKLRFEENYNGKVELMAKFSNRVEVPFLEIASTGTQTLLLYFIWSIYAFENVSFLFIDEFDAFLHFESAELLVKLLNQQTNFQTMLTSHNTYLMNNSLTRPDCCFIIQNGYVKNLFDCTDREIREAHNLEKMYIKGVFTE